MSQLNLQPVTVGQVMRVVNARLQSVEHDYLVAKGGGKDKQAAIAAEVKWELAELKIQMIDMVLKHVEENPETFVKN